MNVRLSQVVALPSISLMLSLVLPWFLFAVPVLGQTGQSSQKPLDDKDNPLLIGQLSRNSSQIGKGSSRQRGSR